MGLPNSLVPSIYDFLASGSISMSSGGHTFVGSTSAATQGCWPAMMNCAEPFNVNVTDDGMATGDRLAYSAASLTYDGQPAPGTPSRALLQLRLEDPSNAALAGTALPTTAPNAAGFAIREVTLFAHSSDLMAPPLYTVQGSVSAITPVPEPGTLALFAFGLTAMLPWQLRRRLGEAVR